MKHFTVLALVLFGACATTPTTSEPAADSVPDGTHGRMRVRLHDIVQEVEYVAEGGHAFYQGDVDLGPITHDRADAIVGLDHRWPHGIVHWQLGFAFDSTDEQHIRAAIAEYNLRTPVQFIEGIDDAHPYITFYESTRSNGTSYTTGQGPDSTDGGDETDVNIHPGTHSSAVVLHELGHALGLEHEQARPDRNTAVSYDSSCTDDGSQFDIADDHEELTPYDIHSIMEYSSTEECEVADSGDPTVPGTSCTCLPLVKKGFSHFAHDAGFISSPTDLSALDVQAITAMYEPQLGSVENDDGFGAAIATGDFDGDGIQDLAVGAPGEAVGATAHTGAIFIYRGTTNGLVAWKTIGELDLTPTTGASGDQFGFALASADFDGDGFDDLVIGAPGARGPTTTARGGTAWVLYGGQGGPSIHGAFELDQTDLGAGVSETGDLFGTSFATGELDYVADSKGKRHPDLAVGVIHEVVGGTQAGYVNTFSARGRTFVDLHGVTSPGETFGPAEFGNSLAIADFDNDGINDLAVGSIGGPNDGAGVYIYHGTKTNFTYAATMGEPDGQPSSQFGAAIAVGHFDNQFYSNGAVIGAPKFDVVVAAPNWSNPDGSEQSAGRLYYFEPTVSSSGALTMGNVLGFGQSYAGQSNIAYDHLGTSLAVADISGDGIDDLIAGVPGKGGGTGMVEVFNGSSSGFGPGGQSATWTLGISGNTIQNPQTGDELGGTLAVGDFNGDGHPDVVGGMPNRNDEGGAIQEWFSIAGLLFTERYFDEATSAPQ